MCPFFCNSTPAAPQQNRFGVFACSKKKKLSPWVAFSVSMLHPKNTVDVFQWAVPCVQNASSKCVILHLNAVEPISFLERSVLLSPKLQDFFVKANEQSASQSLPSSWGSSLLEKTVPSRQPSDTTQRRRRVATPEQRSATPDRSRQEAALLVVEEHQEETSL